MHEARVAPLHYGNAPGTNRKLCLDWTPGEAYTVDSYRRAIHRCCDAAGIQRGSPHVMRQNAATVLRTQFGIDVAATVLGHKIASRVTEHYAEPNVKKACEARRRIGQRWIGRRRRVRRALGRSLTRRIRRRAIHPLRPTGLMWVLCAILGFWRVKSAIELSGGILIARWKAGRR